MANAARADSIRNAIANAVAENVKSYDVEGVCVHLLGLDPEGPDAGDPFSSKRVYVKSRLIRKSVADLEVIARKVIEEYGDDALESLVSQLGVSGVDGELKNLIFAANGPKPEIVLRDAISNVIEITEYAQYCLVDDRPLSEHGLSWRDLVKWWATRYGSGGTERDHGVALYHRLAKSMPEPSCELLLFATFAQVYGRADGFDLPALMPQADTQRYAEMVREDRSLRLAGCTSTASGGRN